MEQILIFGALFFGIAVLYSAVGHGGASGYLAIMALLGMSPAVMKPTALLLNLAVSTISFVQFYQAGHFRWRLFWPLALASVPFSFLGGAFQLDAVLYKKLLGLLLLVPALWLLINAPEGKKKPHSKEFSLLIGGIIGAISGLVGIGGGILLSPLLLLLRWASQKETAAIAALFIFVNSVAGLAGQWSQGVVLSAHMLWLVLLAVGGGLVGAYFGAKRWKPPLMQKILATVLLLAAAKLLLMPA